MKSLKFQKIILPLSLILLSACSQKEGAFFSAALGLGEPRIYVSGGGVASSTNPMVSVYSETGAFLSFVANYGASAEYPRGLAVLDPFNILVAVEGTDRIDVVSIFGQISTYASNANLSGNLFDIRRTSGGSLYIVESNTIERFDGASRVPTSGNPYINTTIGSCVLSTPHGLTLLPNGNLVTVSSGNDTMVIYDVSGTTASCVSSTALTNIDAWDIVYHPNGYLYFVTQLNDSLYRINTDGTGSTQLYQYPVNTTNPSAIAVLPNGNLIVGTQGTDAVDLFDPSGNLLQTSFIRDSLTVDVTDLLVVGGQ